MLHGFIHLKRFTVINHCLHKAHKDGSKTYFHSAITPVIVKQGNNKIISLEPEFIQNRDGNEKQDCENAAAKRWLKGIGLKYIEKGATFLGDDLYCKQPVCELILSLGGNFIFTCKESSHKHLYEEINSFDSKEDLNDDLRALTRYFYFRHWKHLMLFMLEGLEWEDPGG